MADTKKKGFFRGIKSEFKKISWPKKQDVISSTLVVLASLVGVSILVKLIEMVFQFILSFTL